MSRPPPNTSTVTHTVPSKPLAQPQPPTHSLLVGNGAAAVRDLHDWEPEIVATAPADAVYSSGEAMSSSGQNHKTSSRGGQASSGSSGSSGAEVPPSRDQSEFFAATLEHIVRQLDILTQTVTVMEERLSHVEDRMPRGKPPAPLTSFPSTGFPSAVSAQGLTAATASGFAAPRHMMDESDGNEDDEDEDKGYNNMGVPMP